MGNKGSIRICWPDPDKVCIQGGCLWCQDAEAKTEVKRVEILVEKKGWERDWSIGLSHRWAVGMFGRL
jgi:hypothetical protein